jgi:PAS domain S-box-containing protein
MHSSSLSRAPARLAVDARPIGADPRERRLLGILVASAAAIAGLVLTLSTLSSPPSAAVLGEFSLLLATVVSGAILVPLSLRRGAWVGTRLTAGGLAAAAAFQAGGWLLRSLESRPPAGDVLAGTMTLLLVVFLAVLGLDFVEHVRGERAELLSDIALISILTGAAVFLLLRVGGGGGRGTGGSALTAAIAAGAILVVVGWGVLLLWCPTPVHLGLVACATLLGSSAIVLDIARQMGWPADSLMGPAMVAGISLLGLAALLVVEPRLNAGGPRPVRAVQWVRPTLLALSLCGAGVMVVVSLTSREIHLNVPQSFALAAVVFGAVSVRTIMNQVAMVRAAKELEGALDEREAAIASLRSAAQVVETAAARHRLLLDAAVDGIVELDPSGTIMRANGAFCAMVRLPLKEVIGHRWADMVKRVGRARESLASLPETGEAVLVTDAGTTYLEARSSTLPTTPPGKLLMIRDVTASKTAEQTIRTLLQFLQDRDEDRTRLLQRTNAAIEAERNRIARDLHDGPIQGISATSLSLEAVKLMMESGDLAEALETLRKICGELGEEAVNLRRIMSDLRPPVLEERGLIPAVRELCDRWQRELEVPVSVKADPHSEVPDDVETLAYRVVQEALSNVGKHAAAGRVMVRIEAGSGTLRVEVRDDGRGFDPENAREFLRMGKVGLASMRERAELAGGTLTIKSSPGAGTVVLAMLPFETLGAAPRAAHAV